MTDSRVDTLERRARSIEEKQQGIDIRMARLEATFDEFRRGLEARIDAMTEGLAQLQKAIDGKLTLANAVAALAILSTIVAWLRGH